MDENEIRKELAYYKKQLDQLTGQNMRNDLAQTSLRHTVKQKNDAFAAITVLQRKFSVNTPLDILFGETVKAITTNLSMNRSVILVPSVTENNFNLSHWYGYPPNHFSKDIPIEINIPEVYLKTGQSILVNRKTPADEIGIQIQRQFSINFFIAVPLIHDELPIAFIITGRLTEQPPFSPALDKGDIDSLNAIINLIGSVLQNKKSVELALQKASVEKENKIISAQRDMLERTLNELKTAQAQLIQSEKMASLGELTAGIAHEIQNPLNFVNNFSEVNLELLIEMKDNIVAGNFDEVKEIANNVIDNQEKINHHGKRADGIVKSMLQHSRTTTGIKEPTDINALAEEYLRLAYHGLRAKDNSFNVTMKTHLDETIGNINIIPQDIGRVLLNLYTNAFYAVTEKNALIHQPGQNKLNSTPQPYQPTVTVTTRLIKPPVEGLGVSISVADNGNGIPQKVLDKVFQPFFTTKPTGQGTGLGLSLSYDIVKAHGGEIIVKTKETKGTEFTIQLPMS